MKLWKQFYQDSKDMSFCFSCLHGLSYEMKSDWKKELISLNLKKNSFFRGLNEEKVLLRQLFASTIELLI